MVQYIALRQSNKNGDIVRVTLDSIEIYGNLERESDYGSDAAVVTKSGNKILLTDSSLADLEKIMAATFATVIATGKARD